MKTKRAAIYVRVSTTDQETERQEVELKEYVESRGWSCKIYKDRGHSGAKADRPALNNLVHDIRCRKIDVVVVWALDRLARSLKQLLSIAEECSLLGVDLIALKQNVDTTLPAGRLTFQVLGAVAEFERELCGKEFGREWRRLGALESMWEDLLCGSFMRRILKECGCCVLRAKAFADWPLSFERASGWQHDSQAGKTGNAYEEKNGKDCS